MGFGTLSAISYNDATTPTRRLVKTVASTGNNSTGIYYLVAFDDTGTSVGMTVTVEGQSVLPQVYHLGAGTGETTIPLSRATAGTLTITIECPVPAYIAGRSISIA